MMPPSQMRDAIEVPPGQAVPNLSDDDAPYWVETEVRESRFYEASPVDLQDLLEAEFPPRTWIIEGFMKERDLGMVHAYRGIGKSRFTHGLAVAVAAGGQFLKFSAPAPKGVLLVDGELPREDLQIMLAQALAASEKVPTAPLRILSADLSDSPVRSLATAAGRKQVEKNLAGVSLLILDAVSTLCPGAGPENDANSWDEMQSWLLELRRRGISVLLVHHDGKNGGQRGTSKREDVLSQVVQLKRPADYEASEGARFEVHFTKSRGLFGDAVAPIEARLSPNSNSIDNWTWQLVEDSIAVMVKRLSDMGLTQREIADELKIGVGTVNRALKRAKSRDASVPDQAGGTRNAAPASGTGGGR